MNFDVGEAVSTIERQRVHSRPTVVAIDGRSGVGKSTFARALVRERGAALIAGDDFFGGGTSVRRDTPGERAACCIDWRRQRAALDLLRNGQQAAWQPFDWDRFDGRRRCACCSRT